MGKRIMLGAIVFFLLVLAMVILKSKVVVENQFFHEKMMMMDEMQQKGMGMMQGEKMMAAPMLAGTTWVWTSTVGDDDKTVKPKQAGKFTLTFAADGGVSAMTDCNSFSGTYKVMKDKLVFGEMMGTKKYCDGSQEEVFTKAVMSAESYKMEDDGTLVLMMKDDAGTVTFSPMAMEVEPMM